MTDLNNTLIAHPIWFALTDGTIINLRGLVSVTLDYDLSETSINDIGTNEQVGNITVLEPGDNGGTNTEDYIICPEDYCGIRNATVNATRLAQNSNLPGLL